MYALNEKMQHGVLPTEVSRAVRSRVMRATENQQFPWIAGGLIDNRYFKPPGAAFAPAVKLPLQTASVSPPRPLEAVKARDLISPTNTMSAKTLRKIGGITRKPPGKGRRWSISVLARERPGVPEGKAEALRPYRKAADLGNAPRHEQSRWTMPKPSDCPANRWFS